MSTLNGQPIKDTYPGLIKTTDNAAIDGTLKALEDGAGNPLPIEVSSTGINFTGTVTGVPTGAQGAQGIQGPIGVTGAQGAQGIKGTAGTNGAQGAQGFTGNTGAQGIQGPIGVTGAQGAAGVDGVVQSIVAGTNVTVDNTDPANPVVNASGGGGGGSTPPMTLKALPPSKGSFISSTNSWRTWVATTAYALVDTNIQDTQAGYGIFPMIEGETIRSIQFSVGTTQPASNIWCAIYRLGTDVDKQLVMTDLLLDCGTASSETPGFKTLNLAVPFTMPAGETYGAVGIIIGGDTTGTACKSWSAVVWEGNGGNEIAGDFYRINSRFVNGTNTAPPASLAAATYSSDTNNAIYIVIK